MTTQTITAEGGEIELTTADSGEITATSADFAVFVVQQVTGAPQACDYPPAPQQQPPNLAWIVSREFNTAIDTHPTVQPAGDPDYSTSGTWALV
jgi:hypothetical protein